MSINIRNNNTDVEVSTPYFFRSVPISTSYASNGFSYVSFSQPHYFKTGDAVAVESLIDKVNRLESDGTIQVQDSLTIAWNNDIPLANANLNVSTTINGTVTQKKRENGIVTLQLNGVHRFKTSDNITVSNLGTEFNGTWNISSIPDSTKVRYPDAGPDTTIEISGNITARKRENDLTTLQLDAVHNFAVGEKITVSGLASGWNGTDFVISSIPDNTKIRYSDPGANQLTYVNDNGLVTTQRIVFIDDNGSISASIGSSTSSRSMTSNLVTLNFGSSHRFESGDYISVGGSNPWISGNYTVGSNVGSQYLTYSTAFNSINYGSAFGWTRPLYIDLAASGINNIVYPELPQIYSVTISPTTGLIVGTTLTATESVNPAYRYRSDTITYQWYRSPDLGNQGTLIASGKTYQLTNSDLNQYITAVVTGSNPKGSSMAASAQLLFAGPLPAPTGLSTSSITATSVTLSWNGVSGASSYEYAWGTSPNPTTWSSSGITSSNNVFSVSISGMVSNTTYYFRVRGKKNSNDVDGIISSINFNTRFAAPTVSASRNLASNSYTSSDGPYTATTAEVNEFGRILINTTEPAGGRAATPQFYKIQSFYTSWADVGVFSYSNSTTTGVNFTTNPYLIPRTSLTTGGREYQFRAAICDSSGNTLLSDWSSSTSNVRPFNPPSAPELISIERGADTGNGVFLKINWNNNISSDEPVYGWAVSRVNDNLGDVRNWLIFPTSTQSTWTFKNLSANTSYTLRVKALVGYTSSGSFSNLNVVNAFSGDTSISQETAITATTPGQPTALAAAPNKSGSYPNGIPTINVSWTAPTDTGGDPIESYLYRIGTANPPTGATWRSTGNSNTTLTISTNSAGNNLQLNTLYYIQIRSTNTVGSSSDLTAPVVSARTWDVPSPPSTLSYSNATATGVTISWTTPSNNGGTPIIGYGLQRTGTSPEGPSYSVPNASVPPWLAGWDSSLSGTWFWFRVKSYNDLGISTSFASINPPTVPSQPGAPTNVRTNSRTNTVSWTAPSSNGGGAMTYDVFRSQNLSTWTFQKNVSTTSTTVAATAGTTYYFYIIAKNSIGSSLQSPASIRA